MQTHVNGRFPATAGIFFGLGLGGFFDGIVLHQVLQWHHMVSSWYPPLTVENLRLNTLWDGIFHSATYVFLVLGMYFFWKVAHLEHIYWSPKLLWGNLLLGWGWFNVVEGLVNHHILGIHHVNETVAAEQWLAWDLGFLIWGLAMIVVGWFLRRVGESRQALEKQEYAISNYGNP